MLFQMLMYLCESGFCCLCEIKYQQGNLITHINSFMRGAIEKEIIPRFELLVKNM